MKNKGPLAMLLIIAMLWMAMYPVFCQDRQLNVVVLGAHPDDADFKVGGTAIEFAERGHHVLFVSITNGDAGHHEMDRKVLALRREKEAYEAAKRFGINYMVLDHHDGELEADLEIRHEIIQILREWEADLVIGHRPWDYHPDHRNASTLMQDAAYMVIVPNVLPHVTPLKANPVFLYMEDNFTSPQAFRPDICIDITGSFSQKIYAMSAHESQYFEWLPWTTGSLESVPAGEGSRLEWLAERRKPIITADERENLIHWYGKEKGTSIELAESFEICEYGRQPSRKELCTLFPMLME